MKQLSERMASGLLWAKVFGMTGSISDGVLGYESDEI